MLSLVLALDDPTRRLPRYYFLRDQVSQRLAFLVDYVPRPVAAVHDARDCDAMIVVDTAQASRAGTPIPVEEFLASGRPVINIDHHVANPGFGSANWIVPNASSTSELVYVFLRAMGCAITPAIASLLYVGIHTDTHGFSLPNTTASSLQAAAGLVEAGAAVTEVCERLLRSQARSEFDLAGIIYDNTRVTSDGRISYSVVSYDELTETGCTAADIDDQVSIPRALGGIQMAILFSEGKPGRVRVNFRGEGGVNVLELARQFGGGGHAGAAGAIVDGAADEVVADVLGRAMRQLA
jgi:phosphoesterase RecJ-like protein